ncbi:hypothetical protein [Pantoea sp. B65]|uniref:hypothetical protein n=1 Tax=Pantoea sp. B65 TaxID=2813359 RepID=UPI0039B66C70
MKLLPIAVIFAPGWPCCLLAQSAPLNELQKPWAVCQYRTAEVKQDNCFSSLSGLAQRIDGREGDKTQARIYLQKALQAAPRAGLEIADHGRRQDIRRDLIKLLN